MAGKDALEVRLQVDGLGPIMGALRDLPKEATKAVGEAAMAASRILAGKIAAAGHAEGSQAALLAGTVKAKFGAKPGVRVGGSGALGRNHVPADRLVIGSEFGVSGQGGHGKGSRNYAPHGFKPRNSPTGLWIFPTVRDSEKDTSKAWNDAAQEIIHRFRLDAQGGGAK